MNAIYSGTCHCNQIELSLSLPDPLSSYSPRACDCDFCSQNDVLFLSDPAGSLDIISTISLAHVQQDSGQAEFISCVNCEQVVAVITYTNDNLRGAINADCLHDAHLLASPMPVSSAQSSGAADKKARWRKAWMPVSLSEPD